MLRMIVIVIAAVVAAIVLALAAMIVFGTGAPKAPLASIGKPFESVDWRGLPALEQIPARAGGTIGYRVWRESPQTDAPSLVVIAIHGSSASSSSLHPLGKALSTQGIAFYAPDIRGHGATGRRGDIDYAGELDDDFADFVAFVRAPHPHAELALMGFSSGGGYALHLSALPVARNFARAVLISPMLGAMAPTYRPGEMYAKPFIPRIIALVLLNHIGIHWFDHLPTLALAIDPSRADILTGRYSFLLMRAFGTADYAADFRQARIPLAVLVGGNDELFDPAKFAPTIGAVRADVPVTIIPGLSHIEMTTEPAAVPAIAAALRGTAG